MILVGDFSLYDYVLDIVVMFGLVLKCFEYDGGLVLFEMYFDIVWGIKGVVVFMMIKWFNINYYYIVFEFEECMLVFVENWLF